MRIFKTHVMRNLFVISVVLSLVMLLTGCSEVEAPTAAQVDSSTDNATTALFKRNVINFVSVGGADICESLGLPTGCDANFSLTAVKKADGSVSGQWQDTFAGGGGGIHVAVDCMNIVNNGAVIGGVITHGNVGGEDVSGLRALTAVVDNGRSANDLPDQLSFSFFPTGELDCSSLIPTNFTLFNLAHGQVVVK